MRFEMQADDAFINFLVERVYRGTVLEFRTSVDVDPADYVAGWVTGLDEDYIQVCDIGSNYRIVLLARQHIVSIKEWFPPEGSKPFKINDLEDIRIRRQVLGFTEKLRDKASQIKEDRIAN